MVDQQDRLWITYLSPMRLITREGEKISFSLDEINNCTYDHSLLCRVVGHITNAFNNVTVSYIVCGDGALAINNSIMPLSPNDLLLNFNDLLCKLLIGGLYVEAISNKDLATGSLHGKNAVWPVNFGHSYNSHMHACIRMKLTNSFDAIMLDGAASNAKTLEELKRTLSKGCKVIDQIKNMSTYYLITGVTELMYGNWSSAVSNLWIIAEQITDHLWINDFLADISRNPEIPTRKQSLMQDNRTYSASVKQEILYQVRILPENVYSDIYSVRKARNKLVHEGNMVSEANAKRLYRAVNSLMQIATNQPGSELLPIITNRQL